MAIKSIRYLIFLKISLFFIAPCNAQNPTKKKHINLFQANYVGAEIIQNTPFGISNKEFIAGDFSWTIGFKHNLYDKWFVGISLGFIRLKKKADNDYLSLLHISEETMYIFRLHHPIYALVGYKFNYLLATKKPILPPVEDKNYKVDIGAAICLSLLYQLTKRSFLYLKVDRWRGTTRREFFGTETGIGFSYALP